MENYKFKIFLKGGLRTPLITHLGYFNLLYILVTMIPQWDVHIGPSHCSPFGYHSLCRLNVAICLLNAVHCTICSGHGKTTLHFSASNSGSLELIRSGIGHEVSEEKVLNKIIFLHFFLLLVNSPWAETNIWWLLRRFKWFETHNNTSVKHVHNNFVEVLYLQTII